MCYNLKLQLHSWSLVWQSVDRLSLLSCCNRASSASVGYTDSRSLGTPKGSNNGRIVPSRRCLLFSDCWGAVIQFGIPQQQWLVAQLVTPPVVKPKRQQSSKGAAVDLIFCPNQFNVNKGKNTGRMTVLHAIQLLSLSVLPISHVVLQVVSLMLNLSNLSNLSLI